MDSWAWLQVVGGMIARELNDKARMKQGCYNLLDKLKEPSSAGEAVNNVMSVSYQELNEEERDLFLDIACILHGWPKQVAETYWDGCVAHSSTDSPVPLPPRI